MNKYLSALIIGIFFIISLQFIISNIKSLKTVSQDFEVFYLSGQQLILGKNPYLRLGGDIVRNPPPTMFIFSLFTFLPVKSVQTVWFILSFFSFIVGSYYVFRIFDKYEGGKYYYSQNWKIWLSYLSLILIFFPFRYNLGSGQVNNLLFLLLALVFYFLSSKKNSWAAFCLSLAILLKITPIFLLFIFFIQKKFKLIITTIFHLLVILITTLMLLGGGIYQNYLSVTKSFFNFDIYTYYNQSITGFLARTFNNVEITKWLLYIVIIISLAILAYLLIKNKKNNFESDIIFWNISIIYMLILAPFAWQYHFIIIIFPLVTTVYIGYKKRQANMFFVILAISYLLIGWNIKNIGTLNPIILSHVFFGSVILLLLNYYLIKK